MDPTAALALTGIVAGTVFFGWMLYRTLPPAPAPPPAEPEPTTVPLPVDDDLTDFL